MAFASCQHRCHIAALRLKVRVVRSTDHLRRRHFADFCPPALTLPQDLAMPCVARRHALAYPSKQCCFVSSLLPHWRSGVQCHGLMATCAKLAEFLGHQSFACPAWPQDLGDVDRDSKERLFSVYRAPHCVLPPQSLTHWPQPWSMQGESCTRQGTAGGLRRFVACWHAVPSNRPSLGAVNAERPASSNGPYSSGSWLCWFDRKPCDGEIVSLLPASEQFPCTWSQRPTNIQSVANG